MLRERFITWLFDLTHMPYASVFKRNREPWSISNDELVAMPEDRFGHALGVYMKSRNLTFMPRLESHDVLHLLTGMGIDVRHEIGLQWLLVGNGKRSAYSSMVVFIGGVLFPEQVPWFHAQYRRGQQLPRFYSLPFRELLSLSRDEVATLMAP